MPCYHPVPYFQRIEHRTEEPAGDLPGGRVTISGDVRINPPIGAETGYLPCGNCLGCKAARATSWAYRCMHEASLYEHNRFITLTYDNEHLPEHGWLNLRDVQLWMKRLRKAIPTKLRYFLTGEYGAITSRPHYHAFLFNCRFPDEKPAGKDLILSDIANNVWGKGEVRTGRVTLASALYVAKYAVKGTKGHPSMDGEAPPEPFATMSRGGRGQGLGGIGSPWLKQYEADLKYGYLIHQGAKVPIPRAYRKKLSDRTRLHIDDIRAQQQPRPAESRERLLAAEAIHKARLLLYNRDSL